MNSKEEKLKAQKEITEVLLKYQGNLDSEVTERLKADMQSDNKLSKSIRPASLIFTTFVVSAFAITDGNFGDFMVDKAYITLFQSLMLLQYGFYFGSRGIEKITKGVNINIKGKK